MDRNQHYVLGADFGTDSVRVVIVDAFDGNLVLSRTETYSRWADGAYCDPIHNQFRKHPLDYIESFRKAVRTLTATDAYVASHIKAIGVDTTGSTCALCFANGSPLALDSRFANDPDAMFFLWKDHTAVDEAEQINRAFSAWNGPDYRTYSGTLYSSEWYWAKLLHVLHHSPSLACEAAGFIEHCDWFPALLTNTNRLESIKRSRCAAGHKAMWHQTWGGYPSNQFLSQLDTRLVRFSQSLGTETYTSDQVAGLLDARWAAQLGLPNRIPVCVGAFDAHFGAVGGGVAKHVLVKNIGTSTVDIIVGPKPERGQQEKIVSGFVGQVDGSVIPGFIGYEGGQSAFGDYIAWWRNMMAWPLTNLGIIENSCMNQAIDRILPELEKQASIISTTPDSPLALDWINGRRMPSADQRLRGALTGFSLGTDAAAVYRAILESTAFGARSILDCLSRNGITIEKIIAVGGVARKSSLAMQILSDVTGSEIHITDSEQTCAIGAAIYASVAARLYPHVIDAQRVLRAGISRIYTPQQQRTLVYDSLYEQYQRLGSFEETLRAIALRTHT